MPLRLNARLSLERFEVFRPKGTDLLDLAVEKLKSAVERNPADFQNYAVLTKAYNLLAQNSANDRVYWLGKAFENAEDAIEHYPGSGRLHIEMAEITEKLNKPAEAIKHYEKAVEIEDSYQKQFQIMYPGREMFSRLGNEKYNYAKKRIKELKSQTEK